MGNKNYIGISREEKIDNLVKSLRQALGDMDPRTFWPAAASQVEPYFSDYFALDWLKKFREDKDKFTNALYTLYPNKLRSIFYHALIPGLKVLKKYGLPKNQPPSQEEILDMAEVILNAIHKQTPGEVFCRDGGYKYWSDKKVRQEIIKKGWITPKSQEEKKLVGSILRVDGERMVWSVQTDIYRTSASFLHGLYITPIGKLLVHEFFDLDSNVWGIKSAVPAVRVLILYDKTSNVTFTFDFANHYVINIPGPFVHLVKYRIDLPKGVNENFNPTPENLDNLFISIASNQAKVINQLTDMEKLKKMIELGYYQYREFWNYYNESWKPPEAVWRRLSNWQLNYWEKGKPILPSVKEVENTVKLFDPRNDYFGS